MLDSNSFLLRKYNELIRQRKAQTLTTLSNSMDLSWLKNKDYRIINTPELLDWALSEIDKANLIAVDTETTGLNICSMSEDNPIKDKMVGMSISWKRNQGIYIPFRHVKFENIDIGLALSRLKPRLESKSIVTHNGLFDGKVFYDEGIRLNITQDTLLLYFNMDSRTSKGSKGLKSLTRRLYHYDVIELSDIFESESDVVLFKYVDKDLCQAYACADSDHTLSIFLDSFSMLLPSQLNSYRLDIRVQNELIRSEYMGKGIDMKLLAMLNEINNRDLDTLRDLIYKYTGTSLAAMHGYENTTSRYIFNISSTEELADVLFNKLKYPIPGELKGKSTVSVDKHTLKALDDIEANTPDPVFDRLVPSDVLSSIVDFSELHVAATDKDAVLISRKRFLSKACKLAGLVTKYRKLDKLRGSFFVPLLQNNFEGHYYSSIKMTRAETARLVDTIQTLDKYLKKLVVPLGSDKYLVDFDFAQIEYRVMVGLSHMYGLAATLDNPEADYHREGGSLIIGKPPEDITDEERKSLKSVNFGIPYGMSEYGMLSNRYGIGLSESERELHLAEIRDILAKWDVGMHPIREMLDKYRAQALQPVDDSTLPPHLKGQKIGRIANVYGRTRLFGLDDLNAQKRSSIKRQAGNYPIQSFARELYCIAFCDFCDACKRAGLMDSLVPDSSKSLGFRFENKINIMAYIHDECLMSIDADVNPFYVYKLIYENCMKHLEGHPTYYCGINVITNWYEGKDDRFEAPVRYVMQKAHENQPVLRKPMSASDTRDMILAELLDFNLRRVEEELVHISPDCAKHVYDFRVIVPNFKNYHVKPKTLSYLKAHRPIKKAANGKPDPIDYVVDTVETLAIYRHYDDAVYIDMQGKEYTISNEEVIYSETPVEKEVSEYKQSGEEDFTAESSSQYDVSEHFTEWLSLLADACSQPAKTFSFGG